jgi:osmotically-inducible protein OsmY
MLECALIRSRRSVQSTSVLCDLCISAGISSMRMVSVGKFDRKLKLSRNISIHELSTDGQTSMRYIVSASALSDTVYSQLLTCSQSFFQSIQVNVTDKSIT